MKYTRFNIVKNNNENDIFICKKVRSNEKNEKQNAIFMLKKNMDLMGLC